MDETLIERARRGNKEAMTTLIQTLWHDDYYVAEPASEDFFYVGKRAALPLISVLRDRTAPFQPRILAAEALNRLDSPEGTAAQIAVMQDPVDDLDVRRVLVGYVASAGDEQALGPLIDLAFNERADRTMRCSAVVSLGMLLDQRAIAPLLILARGDDPELRQRAHKALDRLGGADRYLTGGPPDDQSFPQRFRSPFPTLSPPAGSVHRIRSGTGSHFHATYNVSIETTLSLSEVCHHYEHPLKRARWAKHGSATRDSECWSEWGFETKWFRRGTVRLQIQESTNTDREYRIELAARWQPARWFSLNWLRDPFTDDDSDARETPSPT
jgi:hypothetical protein